MRSAGAGGSSRSLRDCFFYCLYHQTTIIFCDSAEPLYFLSTCVRDTWAAALPAVAAYPGITKQAVASTGMCSVLLSLLLDTFPTAGPHVYFNHNGSFAPAHSLRPNISPAMGASMITSTLRQVSHTHPRPLTSH